MRFYGEGSDIMKICPQCGEDTPTLNEGYCEPCRVENQRVLDDHNYQADHWDAMSDAERGTCIRKASN